MSIFYNELSDIEKKEFISAYHAKHRNLFGVPRIVINKNHKIKTSDLTSFFMKDNNYFKQIDETFFPIIDNNEISLDEFHVTFDLCRSSFNNNDELFHYLPDKFKKKFNIHTRHQDQERFLISNSKHLSKDYLIVTQCIEEKLNAMWSDKWNNLNSYFNDFNFMIIDNLLEKQ